MPRVRINLHEGQRFGRLTVLAPEVRMFTYPSHPGGVRAVLVQCSCDRRGPGGKRLCFPVSVVALTAGSIKSCGCLLQENLSRGHPTHGLSGHPLYGGWRKMVARCENPKHGDYENYGARGITVCPEWRDLAMFIAWIEGNLGPRPEGMTLNRVDNDGNYEPGNVEWADDFTQSRNRRRPTEIRRQLQEENARLRQRVAELEVELKQVRDRPGA